MKLKLVVSEKAASSCLRLYCIDDALLKHFSDYETEFAEAYPDYVAPPGFSDGIQVLSFSVAAWILMYNDTNHVKNTTVSVSTKTF